MYHSTLGWRVIRKKKKKKQVSNLGDAEWLVAQPR